MAFVHQDSPAGSIDPQTLPPPSFPPNTNITSRFVDTTPYSLVFHVLESLPPTPRQGITKLILLVHGFPDLAYSWRKVLPQLAAQGYHAIAYDVRGFGRTFSRTPIDATSFRPINLVRDALALTTALGYKSVSCVVGHDFGTLTAALCSLVRPDIFRSTVLMSHPVKGPPALPYLTSPSYGTAPLESTPPADIQFALSQLNPPRKHYKWYYCTPSANDDMTHPTGDALQTFLRGYFHLKSADWKGNTPRRLTAWSAKELEQLPGYYIMGLNETMRETVARDMVDEDLKVVRENSRQWLDDEELSYYAEEYTRTTFQGGLNWYHLAIHPDLVADICVWVRSKISVPISFVSGKQDWGSYQEPGALESLENGKFVEGGKYRGTVLIDDAGHWVNQEQPDRCVDEILKLVREIDLM